MPKPSSSQLDYISDSLFHFTCHLLGLKVIENSSLVQNHMDFEIVDLEPPIVFFLLHLCVLQCSSHRDKLIWHARLLIDQVQSPQLKLKSNQRLNEKINPMVLLTNIDESHKYYSSSFKWIIPICFGLLEWFKSRFNIDTLIFVHFSLSEETKNNWMNYWNPFDKRETIAYNWNNVPG